MDKKGGITIGKIITILLVLVAFGSMTFATVKPLAGQEDKAARRATDLSCRGSVFTKFGFSGGVAGARVSVLSEICPTFTLGFELTGDSDDAVANKFAYEIDRCKYKFADGRFRNMFAQIDTSFNRDEQCVICYTRIKANVEKPYTLGQFKEILRTKEYRDVSSPDRIITHDLYISSFESEKYRKCG